MTRNELLSAVRHSIQSGATVGEMLALIRDHAELPTNTAIHAVGVLRDVFDLPLGELIWLGGWDGFGSSNPGPTAEELEQEYGERLRANLRQHDSAL